MSKTNISWTQQVWNPFVGCDRVSPGCANCYAIRDVWRMSHNPKLSGYGGLVEKKGGRLNWTGEIRFFPKRLETPVRRRTPTEYFVNSVSDFFHKNISDTDRDRAMAVMALTPQHRYQVLTKRPERAAEYLSRLFDGGGWASDMADWARDNLPGFNSGSVHEELADYACIGYLPNLWLGVSVESREYARRADVLREIPAGVRWLSCEPLLGPLDLDLAGIDWVVVGGESGPGRRPIDPDWVRQIRDRCLETETAFYFKQWGGKTPGANGNELDGRTWEEKPDVSHLN